jgi:6-pyruvoyltetrahydropterin/6-carboxytetrahydropterin synthase
MRTCARRFEFDAAHRVMRHEGKCINLHGHRYVAEVEVAAANLDALGRVVDFSQLKMVIGSWIDEFWDHGALLNAHDAALVELCGQSDFKHYLFADNPTAEVIADELFSQAKRLLHTTPFSVKRVRVWETPNCWAEYP